MRLSFCEDRFSRTPLFLGRSALAFAVIFGLISGSNDSLRFDALGFLKRRFYRRFFLSFFRILSLFDDLLFTVLFFVFLALVAHGITPLRFSAGG